MPKRKWRICRLWNTRSYHNFVLKNPGTFTPVTIIIPKSDPGTCNDFQNCAPGGGGSSLPPTDPCTRARLALSADNVKKAIEDLKTNE